MGTELRRKGMIQWIHRVVAAAHAAGKTINKKQIAAQLAIDNGLTRAKAHEYVELLKEAGVIIEVDGELTLPTVE